MVGLRRSKAQLKAKSGCFRGVSSPQQPSLCRRREDFVQSTRLRPRPVPDEAIAALRPGPATAVVTLSHDIKIDDPALIAALATNAPYVGALGSRRSHAARRERLAAAGLSAEQIDRIDAPVGIDIGAIGPSEIALSIAAAMVGAFHDRG